MIRALGASAFLGMALVVPLEEAGAQDPVGGAIVGGATGAIIGGVLGGGRGAAIGAIIGGATGAAIGEEGEPRPGGYRYYQDACYQQQPDGAWLVISPDYCAIAPAYAQDSIGIAVDIGPPPLPVYDQPPIPASTATLAPAAIPTCRAPSNSRYRHSRPNSRASRCTPAPGLAADRKPAMAAARYRQLCRCCLEHKPVRARNTQAKQRATLRRAAVDNKHPGNNGNHPAAAPLLHR